MLTSFIAGSSNSSNAKLGSDALIANRTPVEGWISASPASLSGTTSTLVEGS